MKLHVFLLLVVLFSACATHKPKQTVDTGLEIMTYNWKRPIIGASIGALSGASWGLHETLVHHYNLFESKYPGANTQYWDPSESWRRKYSGGDPSAGAAYPGSTTILAWTTDAKHLFGTAHRVTLFASAVVITIGDRRPVWHYLLDAGISFVGFTTGFHGIYSLYFR